ncbi:hypothetical protein IAQ61_008816 [Plenodomus lingam]|uniref:uncharacterized protein n=1 Tax=Leptosphaeria maculans TaxID=5022 RepID=UPI00331FE3C3|nr:hypothetical protein IAQ61_008816 [Plenodomus lingam]
MSQYKTYCSSHGSKLSIGVIRRGNLNNICRNEVDALKTANNGAEFTSGPAASLWCASWVKGINVDTQVYGLVGADSVLDLLDDTIGTDLVDLSSLNNLKTTVTIVFIVRWSRQRRADAGMDIGVIGQEAFLCSVVEVGAVVDCGLVTRSATKDLGFPCVPDQNFSIHPSVREYD